MSPIDLIYFGGAFDPVHNGHLDVVKIVRKAFPTAKITIVPGFVVPKTDGSFKENLTPFVDRVAMAVIAFDEWPLVDVSSMEEELPTPNYTFQTVEAVSRDLPASRIAWIIGADQLATFTKWKNARRILELASLIIVPRPAANVGEIMALAQNVAKSLGFTVALDVKNNCIQLEGGGTMYLMTEVPASVSSSEVRGVAAESLSKLEGLVPPAVVEYIADLGLYQQVVGETIKMN